MSSGGLGHIDAPRVSIVIPTFNGERHLSDVLDSVCAQSLTSWELVVFDDGSTDGTVDVVERYRLRDDRIKLHRGGHCGVADTRNRGFAQTDPRSPFVVFLDMDDRWEPHALESLTAVLERDEHCVSVYGQLHCMDESGHLIAEENMAAVMRARRRLEGSRSVSVPADAPLTFSALVIHNWVTTPGLHLIRRPVAEQVGGFDPATVPADDWDFNLRVSRLGPIAFLDTVVLHWRRHPGAHSNVSPRWKHAYYSVRRKMLLDPSNSVEQRRVARAGYTWMARDAVGQAGQALRERRVPHAARHFARAAQSMVERGRAEVSGLARRCRA
jgi:glycosyltransferase involved in cell wall biosynthesis